MPDHWHGVVELREGSLAAVVGNLKGRSARVLRQACPQLDRVWAGGFHDRALRVDESLVDAARYVVSNPVRAKLVVSVREYPFWDAVWL